MKNTKLGATILNHNNQDADCIMTICPGCTDQRGDRLRATLLAVKNAFDFCTIIFADTLDVHNMLRTCATREEGMEAAVARGHVWLRSYYHDVLECLEDKFAIIPWDRVRTDPSYPDRRRALGELYKNSSVVKREFDNRIDRHTDKTVLRMKKRGLAPDRNRLRDLSRDYLLEEYAGLTVIRSWTAAPEIYPGDCINDPDFFNRHGTVETAAIDLRIPVVRGVRFEKKQNSMNSIAAGESLPAYRQFS